MLKSFRFLDKIGEGGFSVVYSAIELRTNQKVAIKIVPKSLPKLSDNTKYLKKEIEIMMKIHHPSIVSLYNVMEDDKNMYLVMEMVEGENLRDIINHYGNIAEQTAKKYFAQIINAMKYLHQELGIVHRDLKLDNIIIDSNDNVRIIDFGLSTFIPDNGGKIYGVCGSPAFIAPELVKGESYDEEIDIWVLGVDLYTMVYGHLPFERNPGRELLNSILYETPKYSLNVSIDAIDLIQRMLEKNHNERITLKEIYDSIWVKSEMENGSIPMFSDFPIIDLDVIEQIDPNDEYREKLVSAINNNVFSVETATYRIMLKNKILSTINDKCAMEWRRLTRNSLIIPKDVLYVAVRRRSRVYKTNFKQMNISLKYNPRYGNNNILRNV